MRYKFDFGLVFNKQNENNVLEFIMSFSIVYLEY